MATVRILRSTTAGNTPSSLVSGQIAINESDGKLFYRNAAGAVTLLPTGGGLARHATTAGFPATGQEGVLYLSVDTSKIYRWESTVYVEVGAVATSVSASDITSGILPDARLSSAVATYANLAAAANQPTSGIDIYPRGEAALLANAPASGTVWMTFFTPATTITVSSITMVSANTTAAAGLTLARMGLYTFDGTTATLVARVASDTTLFTATATSYQRSFATAGGFPSSYQLVSGTRYGVAVLCVGTTMPNLASRAVGIGVSGLSPRMSGTLTSQSDLPASSAITVSQQSQPFARLT